MSETIQLVLFVLSGSLLSLLLIKRKNSIFIFRSLGLIVALSIIFAYHLNWLFHEPINIFGFSALFILLSLIVIAVRKIKFREITKLPNGFQKRSLLLTVLTFVIPFVLGIVYFQGQLGVPRYYTPDSGTHFLYMSQTARTGVIPLFAHSEIYPASGNLEVFKLHHESYLPGSVVAFFIVSKFLGTEGDPMAFQVFNVFWYSALAVYFFLIFRSRGYFKSMLLAGIIYGLIILGTFFDFVATSYSAQLFGLFILVYFLDTFQEFIEERGSILLPMVGLAALGMTYVYWLPVAALFVLNSIFNFTCSIFKIGFKNANKYKNNIAKILIMAVGSLVSGGGYLAVLLRINMLSHAVDDGGFSFQHQILSDAVIIAPIALLYFVFILIRRWKTGISDFLSDASFSIFLYATTLFVLYENEIVSHYTAVKVMYLLVPLVWVVFVSFLDRALAWRFAVGFKEVSLYKKDVIRWSTLLIVLYALVYFYAENSKWLSMEMLPLEQKNWSLITDQSKDAIMSREQMRLLDKTKSDYSWTLQDNRLVIIAPPSTALWSFAYAHIWPRTANLLVPGEQVDSAYSPMSIYSPNIIDYPYWLTRNDNHVLVFFDTNESRKWAKKVGFNLNEYDVLIREGDNLLLRYKK